MDLGHYGWSRNIRYFQTNAEFLIHPAPVTSNYGLLNLGDGPFDGNSSGSFIGNSNGTYLTINAAPTYTGSFIDLQLAGTSTFLVDSTGKITSRGVTMPDDLLAMLWMGMVG